MRTMIVSLGAIAALGLLAMPAMAQMQELNVSQTAASETTSAAPQVEIYSGGAPTTDLNMSGYEAFDQFAQENPQIIRQLHRNPRLVNNPSYAQRHPEFAEFLKEHPKVAEDLAENPGNYLAGSTS